MITKLASEKAAFQIRSSWAQFCRILRFWRVEKSITYVFSTSLNIPTPPPPRFELPCNQWIMGRMRVTVFHLCSDFQVDLLIIRPTCNFPQTRFGITSVQPTIRQSERIYL